MIRRREFEVGELVRVSDGPFARFNGTLEEVDEAHSRWEASGLSCSRRSLPA